MIENVLLGVLWACIITMLITLHRLGRLIDRMLDTTKVIRINLDDIMNDVQKKIKQEKAFQDWAEKKIKQEAEDEGRS